MFTEIPLLANNENLLRLARKGVGEGGKDARQKSRAGNRAGARNQGSHSSSIAGPNFPGQVRQMEAKYRSSTKEEIVTLVATARRDFLED